MNEGRNAAMVNNYELPMNQKIKRRARRSDCCLQLYAENSAEIIKVKSKKEKVRSEIRFSLLPFPLSPLITLTFKPGRRAKPTTNARRARRSEQFSASLIKSPMRGIFPI